jgi:hypothetical protein
LSNFPQINRSGCHQECGQITHTLDVRYIYFQSLFPQPKLTLLFNLCLVMVCFTILSFKTLENIVFSKRRQHRLVENKNKQSVSFLWKHGSRKSSVRSSWKSIQGHPHLLLVIYPDTRINAKRYM